MWHDWRCGMALEACTESTLLLLIPEEHPEMAFPVAYVVFGTASSTGVCLMAGSHSSAVCAQEVAQR